MILSGMKIGHLCHSETLFRSIGHLRFGGTHAACMLNAG
jgi:hypothetical protein